MIEMQFIIGTTLDTLATIALPDGEFYRCRNNAPAYRSRNRSTNEIFFVFNCDELELKDAPVFVELAPRIY